MIDGIEIERLRGIHQGKLENLTPLTILVGPSGSGKSTILDALLIGTSRWSAEAVGQVVKRRAELSAGAPWLFERGSVQGAISLRSDTMEWKRILRLFSPSPGDYRVDFPSLPHSGFVRFTNADNHYETHAPGLAMDSPPMGVRLVEPIAGANHPSLVRAYEDAYQQGRIPSLRKRLPEVLSGAIGLRTATFRDTDRDVPILHVEFDDHSVPVAAAGSGVYSIVRLALELASPPDTLLLVEEPESHQHRSVIGKAAKLLLQAASERVQVVVSTHSLELIDALVANATEADLERLSVFRVVTDKGILRSSRFSGAMVTTARQEIDEDLR